MKKEVKNPVRKTILVSTLLSSIIFSLFYPRFFRTHVESKLVEVLGNRLEIYSEVEGLKKNVKRPLYALPTKSRCLPPMEFFYSHRDQPASMLEIGGGGVGIIIDDKEGNRYYMCHFENCAKWDEDRFFESLERSGLNEEGVERGFENLFNNKIYMQNGPGKGNITLLVYFNRLKKLGARNKNITILPSNEDEDSPSGGSNIMFSDGKLYAPIRLEFRDKKADAKKARDYYEGKCLANWTSMTIDSKRNFLGEMKRALPERSYQERYSQLEQSVQSLSK